MSLSRYFFRLFGTKKEQKHTTLMTRRVLVLGYYDRKNTGDEMYKTAIPKILGASAQCTFVCTDDLENVEAANYDVIVVGGGDVINSYFLSKVSRITYDFEGPVYAFSVGIGYEEDAKRLDMFDHVFVRSHRDLEMARARIGSKNVTYTPDACFVLAEETIKSVEFLDVGVCLAGPVLRKRTGLFDNLLSSLVSISSRSRRKLRIHTIPFNLSQDDAESDLEVSTRFVRELKRNGVLTRSFSYASAHDVIDSIKKMEIVVAMRFHSAVFGVSYGCKTIQPCQGRMKHI